MIDIGQGPPLVLLPGIQGRWEWIAPAAHALAEQCRVITCSLPGEPQSLCPHDAAHGFEMFVRQIDLMLDRAGVAEAAVCGVSFGGLVAAHYAARRPERTRALVITSAPGPGWVPDARARRYMRAPVRSIPAFAVTAARRLLPEMRAAMPATRQCADFFARHVLRALAAPMSPRRTADRLRLLVASDTAGVCACVEAPTLVVTGEPGLDRVVPVESTRGYAAAIRGAEIVQLDRTGHVGLVTRPHAFADIVGGFVRRKAQVIP
jgi:pimeloyl-ACP methyl ester carboxylesterase